MNRLHHGEIRTSARVRAVLRVAQTLLRSFLICVVSCAVGSARQVTSQEQLWAFAPGGYMARLDPRSGEVLGYTGGVHHLSGPTGLTARAGRLYMLEAVGFSIPPLSKLVEVVPADSSHRVVGSLGVKAITIPSIEFNPTDNTIYAIIQQQLCMLNPVTGTATVVAPLQGMYTTPFFHDFLIGLAFDRTGRAYVAGVNGPRLYALDVRTGIVTLLTNLDIAPGAFVDLAFRSDGVLWGNFSDASFFSQRTGLYEIDLDTFAVTLKQPLSDVYSGIAFMPAPEITSYCSTQANSQGCTPIIQASGVPSVGAHQGFGVRATNVINQVPGQLLYGVRGRDFRPFRSGVLCIAQPVQRFPLQFTGGTASGPHDCTGSLTVDINTFVWFGGGDPLLRFPGTTVDVQWLSRDPGLAAPFDTSLTSAIEFVVGP